MKNHLAEMLLSAALLCATAACAVQDRDAVTPERARDNFARRVVLAPDDVRAFPDAPKGFDVLRPGIAHGVVETLVYTSGVTGTRREARVYVDDHAHDRESWANNLYRFAQLVFR
jgi:hypothetical protein